ncbi:hypothetical protein O7626_25640 [Micromonospora sp. WMMD1102]|uniref:hypothetical protein n=1 Tax=Micromonospora sp. WMMD1102 TaxID=3016105 RepID=UPI002414D99C|nr:hypothetical protein [Micromonospora sp. WMMD1102]MDG4789271.1 hypothetical protein [Micromonospora sp. WMMD1102]
MCSRLLRSIAASAVALTMLLTGAAQPARANVDGISGPIVDLSLIAWNVYRSGGATPEQIVEFVRLVSGALTGLQNEVVGHADGLEAAEVLGQATSVHIDMLDYHNFRDNEILLESFAMEVGRYAQNANNKYQAVDPDSKRAKDQIGLGAQVLYPITLAARTDAGWTGGLSTIEATYRELNRKIVADLEPRCTRWSDPEPIPGRIYVRHECVAANGETAVGVDHKVGDKWHSGPVNLDNLKLEAARNSSWAAAKRILAGQGQ